MKIRSFYFAAVLGLTLGFPANVPAEDLEGSLSSQIPENVVAAWRQDSDAFRQEMKEKQAEARAKMDAIKEKWDALKEILSQARRTETRCESWPRNITASGRLIISTSSRGSRHSRPNMANTPNTRRS